MGVINITPNSFSDGGEFNNSTKFLDQARYLIKHEADILDLGAESSAPMNKAIDTSEEIARFKEVVLPVLDQISPNIDLSIDTYKIETIQYLLKQKSIRAFYDKELLTWNDVSGQNHEAEVILRNYPKLKYIHCHNLVDDRSKTLDHMSYLSDDLCLENFFENSQHILDPCFGFSKTREQNFEVWKSAPVKYIRDYLPC